MTSQLIKDVTKEEKFVKTINFATKKKKKKKRKRKRKRKKKLKIEMNFVFFFVEF